MLTKNKQLKSYQGIIVFSVFILLMLFISKSMQIKFGIYSSVLKQFIILLFGIVPVIVLKADFKETFPIKKPLRRQVLGVLILWSASFITSFLINFINGYFFPQAIINGNNTLENIIRNSPMLVSFLIIALMPAIFEEVFHRGFIFASLNSIKNKWIKVLLGGLIFGIFHLDPYKFLITAVLGMILTYIMIQTENIILPMIVHFTNNALGVLISSMTKSQGDIVEMNSETMIMGIGGLLIIGSAVPFLLLLGSKLISKKKSIGETEDIIIEKKIKNKKIIIGSILSITMILLGVGIMALNVV